MKLTTLLKYGIIISLAIIFFLSAWIFNISQSHLNTSKNSNLSFNIINTAFELNTLTSDYLLYSQSRASRQWNKTHEKLGALLVTNPSKNLSVLIDINPLVNIHKKSLYLFERISKIQNSINTSTAYNKVLEKQKKALTSQLLTTMQIMISHAKELSIVSQSQRKDIEQKIFWLILLILFTFITTLFIIWYMTAARVVIPINNLKKYIEQINIDNLSIQPIKTKNDEIGSLAKSFHQLSQHLFDTLVSKDKLRKEIKDRENAETELRHQQDINTAVIEGAANSITITDIDCNIVQFNNSAEKLTGYSRQELIGRPIWDQLIPIELKKELEENYNSLIKSPRTLSNFHEIRWLTKEGEYKTLECHISVIRDNDEQITHIVSFGYDITQRKEEEIKHNRLERELTQSRKMEALGKLTGGVAHDFNNMLGIILGYTELSIETSKVHTDKTTQNYLNQIKIASARAKDLVAQMLSFSRADLQESKPMQLGPLLDENTKLFKSIIPSTIKINLTKELNLPDVVMDATKFQQALMNLVINSKDATNGSGEININLKKLNNPNQECSTCHHIITGKWIEVSVSDNGSGMSADISEKIFDPFFTTKGIGEGTGMGLSVLHGIIKSHHGHIILESTPNIGTTFRLLLPPDETNTILVNGNKSKNQTTTLKGNNEKILLVDDQEALLNFQKDLLTLQNYQCTIETDSEKALDIFLDESNKFDLIISDQTMPKMTGLELINTIRQHQPSFPAILTTGYSDKVNQSICDDKKITLLHKPFNTEQLLNAVSMLLKQQS